MLFLKARSEENSLDQRKILTFINENFARDLSVSTVSRTLTKMVNEKYCCAISPEKGKRGKTRYYFNLNPKKLALDRTQYHVQELTRYRNSLGDLRGKLISDESICDEELRKIVSEMLAVYDITLKIYKEFLLRIEDELKNIKPQSRDGFNFN